MNVVKVLSPFIIGMAVAGTASSQVYESKDAEGNTVFSDRPSEGAQVIEVQPTNSADPIAEIPEPLRPASAPDAPRRSAPNPPARDQQANEDDYIYYGDEAPNKDETRDQREEIKERREEGTGKPGSELPARVKPHRNPPRPATGGGRR